MTWPIVELAFWNPGEPGSRAVDALLADAGTPLARHGLTGIAARYAAETGAQLHPEQQWWIDELTMKSLGVDGALTEVAPAFDRAGLPWFTAKGPAVAYVDYPDTSMRPYTDLDVYVPESARAEATTVLEALRYEKVPQVVGPLGGQPCEYHGGRFGAVVELHSHVVDNIHNRWLPHLEEWMHHVVRNELCGVDVNVLAPDAHACLQAIHLGAGHRYARLNCYRDIDLLAVALDRGVADTLGATPYLRTALAVLRSWRREVPELDGGGRMHNRLVTSLRSDPRTWDEFAPSARNVLALANQSTVRAGVTATLAASRALLPERGRRASPSHRLLPAPRRIGSHA